MNLHLKLKFECKCEAQINCTIRKSHNIVYVSRFDWFCCVTKHELSWIINYASRLLGPTLTLIQLSFCCPAILTRTLLCKKTKKVRSVSTNFAKNKYYELKEEDMILWPLGFINYIIFKLRPFSSSKLRRWSDLSQTLGSSCSRENCFIDSCDQWYLQNLILDSLFSN